jgi:hypothetical protein
MVTATQATRVVPLLLVVLIAVVVGDLVMILVRWLRRRRQRRAAAEQPTDGDDLGPDGSGHHEDLPAPPDSTLVGATAGAVDH